jgi:hypothetical protein
MADKAIAAIKTDQTLPDLPRGEVEEAKKQGALDAVRESAKTRFATTDGVGVTEDVSDTPQATYDVFHLTHLLDLDPAQLKKVLNGKAGPGFAIPSQGQVGGLLEVERSGKNRTDVVEVLLDVLGIESPYAVTDAGPAYTNDVTRIGFKRG